MSAPPLIAHVIHRLGMGGLENGLVNLINHLPQGAWRHAVICLTDATDYASRIERDDVSIHELHKREGKDPRVLLELWRVLRRLRPRIVHSRNLAALEAQLPALLAGVRVRIHGEHGRDIYDLTGDNRKYLWLRRAMRPLVSQWVPMSRDLAGWLEHRVGVPAERITQLYNGVDTARFVPATTDARAGWPEIALRDPSLFVIGAVGRMESVKHPLNLVRAFVRLARDAEPQLAARLRLVYLGAGPLHDEALRIVSEAGLADRCWLPGARDDVAQLMPGFDLFVLPSLGEGISNTILEAMACGLPVLATDVGGNAELVGEGTGTLVPSDDCGALADEIAAYARDPQRLSAHGRAGRARVETEFALPVMVDRYHCLYSHFVTPGEAKGR